MKGDIEKWVELGKKLLEGYKIEELDLKEKNYAFLPSQKAFLNDLTSRYILTCGGYGSGKSLALYVKLLLFVLCFPENRVLLGRKTLSDIERAVLPDLFELIPYQWYEHRVKDAVINFFNGSQVILFGLDALQTGDLGDIKKAQQKLKSLNLGAYFIDQLEEVEFDVFDSLNSRLRRMNVPIRQGNMTCNPANFWAYDWFKANPREGTKLYTGSMLENKENLPEDYLKDQLNHEERYVRRYVYGEWTPDVLTDKIVFSDEHLKTFQARRPLMTEESCEIYENPASQEYRMGVDPSEGVVDPSSISIVSQEGKKVAKFNGKIPIHALIEKVKFLYYKYRNPLIIPEANSSGAALLEGIKDLKVYRRKQFEYKNQNETEKLGFKTSFQSKQALIDNFKNLLRQGFPKIYDEKTINELKTFVWSNEVKQSGAGAQRGFHDDDVMSTLLAFWEFTPQKIEIIKAAKAMPHRRKVFQYY